ncbi:Hypothetical protein NTJ_08975 [Nesidiocoris tenuis]|uniref:Uncharacterized protein n=1 Tax=Nesidiocoris tenuis TaxID=355587 RepID=A0ABN7AZ04_9HEMI|nr:Hypothetical protein NTJ_08975 [Nesidiocoris tenuis]
MIVVRQESKDGDGEVNGDGEISLHGTTNLFTLGEISRFVRRQERDEAERLRGEEAACNCGNGGLRLEEAFFEKQAKMNSDGKETAYKGGAG